MDSIEKLKSKIAKNIDKNVGFHIFRPTNHLLEFLTDKKDSCVEKITIESFYNDGEELRVDENGLLIFGDDQIEWSNIYYMYFRTDWDGEGNYPETRLHILLESGKTRKVDIENLNRSKSRIGQILYCAMKQFKVK